MSLSFTAQYREKVGKGANRKLKNCIDHRLPHNPGVVYGLGEQVNISMRTDTATRFIREILKNRSQRINLIIEKGAEQINKLVVLQDYQLLPTNNMLLHVDFLEITEQSIVNIEVPIKTIGESKAVKLGGIMQLIRHSLVLRGKVADLPASIDIDISELDFGDSVHINDLKLPAGVKTNVAKNENYALITITTPVEEVEVKTDVVTPEVAATTPITTDKTKN